MKVWPKFFDVVFLPPHQLPHVPGQPGFVAQPINQPINAPLRDIALVPNLQVELVIISSFCRRKIVAKMEGIGMMVREGVGSGDPIARHGTVGD